MKKNLNIIFLVLYASLPILFFAFMVEGKTMYFFSGIPLFPAIILLFVTSRLAVRGFGLKSVHSKAILLLLAGTIIKMFSAAMTYNIAVWEVATHPYLLLNIITVAGYLLMFGGLIIEIRQYIFDISWSVKKIITISVSILALLFLVIYFGVIVPNEMTSSRQYILMFFDVLLGICVGIIFFVAREFKDGKMALPWLLILASFLVNILTDVLAVNFAEISSNDWPYNTINLVAILKLILLGHGFYLMRVAVDNVNAELKQQLTNS